MPIRRRIVTGFDAQGHSRFVEDGPSPAILTMEEKPAYRNINMWRTLGSQHSLSAPDSIEEHSGVLQPKGGTVLRIIDIPPEPKDPVERRRQTAAVFAKIFPDAKHDADHARHPSMHVTDTVDYAILLSGELVAILEIGETVMRAGDVLIQRGTNHAWANRSDSVARIAFILIDSAR